MQRSLPNSSAASLLFHHCHIFLLLLMACLPLVLELQQQLPLLLLLHLFSLPSFFVSMPLTSKLRQERSLVHICFSCMILVNTDWVTWKCRCGELSKGRLTCGDQVPFLSHHSPFPTYEQHKLLLGNMVTPHAVYQEPVNQSTHSTASLLHSVTDIKRHLPRSHYHQPTNHHSPTVNTNPSPPTSHPHSVTSQPSSSTLGKYFPRGSGYVLENYSCFTWFRVNFPGGSNRLAGRWKGRYVGRWRIDIQVNK